MSVDANPPADDFSAPAVTLQVHTADPDPPTQPVPAGYARSTFHPQTVIAGRYLVQDELGRGGMGVVQKAFDSNLKRFVAIKKLRPELVEHVVSRFREEADKQIGIEHPNIVKVYDVGIDRDDKGAPYIVFEYIDGGTLAEEIRDRLPRPREAAEKVQVLARAVHFVHEQNIIHRDLKPANVLVTLKKEYKIGDFGLGKRLDDSTGYTQPGDVFGTPQYMAPEQARGDKEIDRRADVYALGGILYKMLTGKEPFNGANTLEILEQVKYDDPVSPSILAPNLPRRERDLCSICLMCLEKNPARRYQTAQALVDDLQRFLDKLPTLARPVPWWEKTWRQARRRPREAALFASAAAIVVLGLGGLNLAQSLSAVRDEKRRQEQEQNAKNEADAATRDRLQSEYDTALGAMDIIRNGLRTARIDPPSSRQQLFHQLTAYYEQVDQKQVADGQSPRRLADRRFELGDLHGLTGDMDKAATMFRAAAEGYAVADPAATSPLDADPVRAAKSHLYAGKYLTKLGRYKEAEAELGLAKRAFEGWAERSTELGETHHQLGEWANAQEKREEAVGCFEASIKAHRRTTKQDTVEWRKNMARGYGFRGDVHLEMGKPDQAETDYLESLKMREEMAKAFAKGSELPVAQHECARGWANLTELHARQRMFGTAIHFLDQAKPLMEKAVANLPNESEVEADNAYHERLRADLLLRRGRKEDRKTVEECLKSAAEKYTKLADRSPNELGPWSGLLGTDALSARLTVPADKAAAQRVVDRFRRLPNTTSVLSADEADRSYHANPKKYSSADVYHYAAMLAVLGDKGGAIKWLTEAVEKRGYRQRHPQDVRADPAFVELTNNAEFTRLVGMMGTTPVTAPR